MLIVDSVRFKELAMRFAAVRVSLFFLFLALLTGVTLLVVSLFEVAASVQRSAQAQALPTVSVSCPDAVAAVGRDDAPGSVECTFSVSPPSGGLTVKYEVTGVGSRSLGYQQSVVVASASEVDRVYYLSEATEITVRVVADSAYSVGSPSEATIAVGTSSAYSGAGLHVNEAEAFDGYTLLTNAHHTGSYLIDNQGRIAYSWNGSSHLSRLLDNGNLLNGNPKSKVTEVSPDGTVVYQHATNNYHHDVVKLANGNFLFINSDYHSRAESIAAGANPACLGSEGLKVDSIIEIQPTGSSGGSVVWQWNVWDHLIQDYDATKDNYGTVVDHPELIDINYGLCQINNSNNGFLTNPHHLTHLNSIDYNASLDQLLITSRHFSEVWVIDRSTTTAEAATSAGGNNDMGGNLLYRYGNPRTHQNGNKSDQRLFRPHNAHWIPSGLEGAGNVLIYNNGHEHPGFLRNYASVDELAFPSSGHTYLRAGGGFMLPTLLWTHRLAENTWIMSNAQRLPNGNTLIVEGNHARISEVTSDGTVVWHYLSPLARGTEVLDHGASPSDPSDVWVYRAYKYAVDHPGIAALTLTPPAERTPLAPADPEVSIAADGDVTEGSRASFTVSASPAPAAALTVTVNVIASGNFGVTIGSRTVTIPTTGSATLNVVTADDSTDEADGSVTVTVTDGAAYDVDSSASTATVNIADDDDTPLAQGEPAELQCSTCLNCRRAGWFRGSGDPAARSESSSSCGQAGVDAQHCPVDSMGFIGGQVGHCRGDVVGLCHSPKAHATPHQLHVGPVGKAE